MLPLPHFLEKAEYVFSLCAFVVMERLTVGIILFRERNDVIFYLLFDIRVNIEWYLDLAVLWSSLLLLRAQICYLKLYLAEFSNHIVETIAKHSITFVLVNLKVQFFKELVFSFNEFLFANTKENGYLRCQSPKLFILDNSCSLGIIFLPKI